MRFITKQIVFLLFLIAVTQSYSQQEPLYTQYYNNFSLLNPAFVGSNGHFTATANIRSQWAGEVGSPETQTFSLQGPAGKNVGLGISVVHDEVFIWKNTDVYADFSYSIQASEEATLSFGLKVGGSFLNVDLSNLGISDDPYLNENINQFNPNIGAGALYYTSKFYASISTVNILETKHYDETSSSSTATDNMVFYLSSGYVFDLNETLKLRPSFLIRGVNGSSLSTDISASFIWNNRLEFGIAHRIDESISGLFQLRVNNHIKVGYSYDSLTNNNLGNYNNGSHEFSLMFDLGKTNTKTTPFYW